MPKLYFYYAAMNAGKSTMLLQANYNYQERGLNTLLFLPLLDNRKKKGIIHSRLGLTAQAIAFERKFNFFNYTTSYIANNGCSLHAILIDEAQFLTKKQIKELTEIVDKLEIAVLTYGLRSDFQGQLFEGSQYLLAWAEEIREIKTMCHCGKKAIMNMRINEKNEKMIQGPQIQIGGNDHYIACCRKHYNKGEGRSAYDALLS